MKLMAFQGNMASSQSAPPMSLKPVSNPDLTPSPDVPLAILKRKLMVSNDLKVAKGLLMEISIHLKVKRSTASNGFSFSHINFLAFSYAQGRNNRLINPDWGALCLF